MAMSLRPEEFYREPPLGKPRRPAEQFVNTIRRRQQGLTLAHLPRRMPISPYNKGVVNDYRREGYRKSGPQTVCWQNIGILALTERDNRFIKWLISFFPSIVPPRDEIGFWNLPHDHRSDFSLTLHLFSINAMLIGICDEIQIWF